VAKLHYTSKALRYFDGHIIPCVYLLSTSMETTPATDKTQPIKATLKVLPKPPHVHLYRRTSRLTVKRFSAF